MTDLIKNNSEALQWVEESMAKFSNNSLYGKIASAVIWTSQSNLQKNSMVSELPLSFVENINAYGLPLNRDHDPGRPVGKVLMAKVFVNENDAFVAALLGFYNTDKQISLSSLGFEAHPPVDLPSELPSLPEDSYLTYSTDPREINTRWSEEVLRNSPLRVKVKELSHNAAEPYLEVIRLSLPYIVLVWNPFIKAIAAEAGKDTYRATHKWLHDLFNKLKEQKKPILVISAYQSNCEVTFIFRGNDVKRNYAAHEALSFGAAQAAQLIANMKANTTPPETLVYEFDFDANRWFPSYAILYDGRFVSDTQILIATEQLPSGLSLGLMADIE